jgi:hypothetical protein
MRNQYKILSEKYDIINDARKPKAPVQAEIGPYEADYFNFLEYTKNCPDQKEFMDWLYTELESNGGGEIEDWFHSAAFLSLPIWERLCRYYDARVQIIDEEGEDDDEMTDNDYEIIKREINEVKIEIDEYHQKWKVMFGLKKLSHIRSR